MRDLKKNHKKLLYLRCQTLKFYFFTMHQRMQIFCSQILYSCSPLLKILMFLDSDINRVPDDLSSLAEVWYLDGSSIYHNNNLGKKVIEKYNKKIIRGDTVS
jgi:hypothetical protein